MIFEGEFAGKLHAKDDEVRTSANGIPRQDQSPWGGFTVLDLLYNDKSHSFVRIQCHASMIAPLLNPSLIPVNEGATAGLSRGLCTTASSVESSA